jgi:squalene-hopene/tetraprenyl-beta-curcumene cyclase
MTPESTLRAGTDAENSTADARNGAGVGFAAAAPRERHRPIEDVIDRGLRWLISAQSQDGYWWGELEADTTLECDYLPYLHLLGKLGSEKTAKLANFIRQRQLTDGGWGLFPGGPSELNATVKAYIGLRLAGDAASVPHLQTAKAKIHELGGLESTNSYVRFYLAMFGAIDWSYAPAIPPELMLLPSWLPVNLYDMSSWTRAIVVPMTIIYALKPSWTLPEGFSVNELFKAPGEKPPSLSFSGLVSWRNVFIALDRGLKLYERSPWKPLRKAALARANKWMLERLDRAEGLATIYPSMMNSVYAMLAQGSDTTDPLVSREIRFLERYEIEERDTLRIQPCISPVWDTAIAMVSLEEAGVDPSHPVLVKAGRWLLENQILGGGDWQVKNPAGAPGGWAFEFRNDVYPDVDDTAFVLMALCRVALPEQERLHGAARRGVAWLLSMQNRDGGWGAFDHENNLQFLNNIPFADHNAMLDPSTSDVTARAMECLGQMGWPSTHPAMQRGRAFLHREQCADGSWFGRWGVNYIYGTSGVLRAVEKIGEKSSAPCRRAAEWLRSVQNTDGGFGETPASYDDESLKGKGKSTASQTAWGLIGLLAVADMNDPAVERAAAWLAVNQNPDGSWDEDEFTGTGFPRVFYLKYHLYRNSFPLYALARYDNIRKGRQRPVTVQIPCGEFRSKGKQNSGGNG